MTTPDQGNPMHFARRPQPHASKGPPVTSDDVVPRILAAIDETERDARAATQGPWRHTPEKHWRKPGTAWCEEAVFAGPVGADAVCVAGTGNSDDPQSMADAAHIARHDPDAVLRRCAADRRRLERHTPIPDHGRFSDDWANECPNPGDCDCGERPKVCGACRDQAGGPLEAPCRDLLDLADSYGVAPTEETADE